MSTYTNYVEAANAYLAPDVEEPVKSVVEAKVSIFESISQLYEIEHVQFDRFIEEAFLAEAEGESLNNVTAETAEDKKWYTKVLDFFINIANKIADLARAIGHAIVKFFTKGFVAKALYRLQHRKEFNSGDIVHLSEIEAKVLKYDYEAFINWVKSNASMTLDAIYSTRTRNDEKFKALEKEMDDRKFENLPDEKTDLTVGDVVTRCKAILGSNIEKNSRDAEKSLDKAAKDLKAKAKGWIKRIETNEKLSKAEKKEAINQSKQLATLSLKYSAFVANQTMKYMSTVAKLLERVWVGGKSEEAKNEAFITNVAVNSEVDFMFFGECTL